MISYRRAFISHAHVDNRYCTQLSEALRQRSVDVWIDLSNMQVGHDLTDEINQELQNRSAFVLMVTDSSNSSYWVKQELSAFNSLMNDRQDRMVSGLERIIIPVRVSGQVPVLIRGKLYIEAAGRAIDVVAQEIANALQIASGARMAPSAPRPPSVQPRLPVSQPTWQPAPPSWQPILSYPGLAGNRYPNTKGSNVGKLIALLTGIASIVLFGVGYLSFLGGSTYSGITFVGFFLGQILLVVAWITGLIMTARQGRWGWFIGILLLTPISTLFYGIWGPDEWRS